MSKIDSAYDYYVSNYANKEVSRYDSHKKSDLRKVYNRIVKTNKESPLYKISNLNDAQKYAIDIKESSKALQNAVSSLSDDYDGIGGSFEKKVAVSSDSDTVDVAYVGDGTEENSTTEFNIQVQKLAAPQINTGNFLENDTLSFAPGSFSFDLTTTAAAYEFQFNVNKDETNLGILEKLDNIIGSSNLGIKSEIIHNELGDSALQLTSLQTGLGENETELFKITPTGPKESLAAMGLLGINNVSSEAENSAFTLNGQEHSSLSNKFTINKAFELTLKKPNAENESTSIGFKTNIDSVADNIQGLLDAYNGIIQLGKQYKDMNSVSGSKLLGDISSVARSQQASLEYIGLMVDGDGAISIDRDILENAIRPDRAENTYNTLKDFKDALGEKAGNLAINPMNYVDKVVVAYKHPGHNFNTPYITSIYSGMMLDNKI